MSMRISDGDFEQAPTDTTYSHDHARERNGEDHSLLAEDPLTGLPWTETLLPLVTNWAGSSAVRAVCLHFVGLGILANIPEFQSSHSLLREAAERLSPLISDEDRLTRFSGNKLLIFSKRSEAAVNGLLEEIAERFTAFGTEVEGRHLPEIRTGMAALGGHARAAVTVEALNALMSDAAGATVPIARVVMARLQPPPPDGLTSEPEPPAAPAPNPPVHLELPETPDIPAMPELPLDTSHIQAAQDQSAAHDPMAVPSVSDQTFKTSEETETMIIRGHPERTPIRPVMDAPARQAVPIDVPEAGHRLILKAVDVAVTGLVATAVIDLDFEGQRVRGKAIGRSSEGHPIALVGEAMTRAVTDLLPAGHGTVFRQAVLTVTEAGEVVVTVVEFLTPDRTDFLFGVAPTEGEPVAGVARSILDAINRRTARLLEASD